MIDNVMIIARKEFSDLVSSRLMLIVLAWYSFVVFYNIYMIVYPFGGYPPLLSRSGNVANGIYIWFAITLCNCGSVVGIVLGFISIVSEVDGKALNTLLVKPLYRDNIINGKLLGVLGFIICLFVYTSVFYFVGMSLYSIVARNAFVPLLNIYIPTFIGYLPVVFIISSLCILFSYSITLLLCLLFKNQSLALFISLFIHVILFGFLDNVQFAGQIANFAGNGVENLVANFGISSMLSMFNAASIQGVLANWGFQFFLLCLYCFITIVLAYIVFIRRDVA
jgi:ABC-2 type transport system permease protein